MYASYWGFVPMVLHLGLHWGFFLGMSKRAMGRTLPICIRPVLAAGIGAYRPWAFLRRDLLTY